MCFILFNVYLIFVSSNKISELYSNNKNIPTIVRSLSSLVRNMFLGLIFYIRDILNVNKLFCLQFFLTNFCDK